MSGLPRKAQVYLVIVCLMALASILSTRFVTYPSLQAEAWEFLLFVALAVLAGGKKIGLMRHHGDEDVGSMSLGFAITFAGMLRFGPAGGIIVGAAACLSGCLYPKRQPLYQMLFNLSLTVTESWLAGLVFLALNNWSLQLSPLESFGSVVGSCLTYFAINTGGVATIIALCTKQNIPRLWKQTFLWTAPSYFAGACVGALALLIANRYVANILLFVSPVAYLTYQSYAVYTSRAEDKQKHIEELQISQANLADLYLATIKSLALAIDAKDQYTHQHILRVQRYAVATAKQMGLSGIELEGVNTGALLHDIGKLGVPEYVLLKPGRLTDEEFAKIKKHPEIGAAILDPVEFPWPVLPVVKYHHEKWDGTGYPEGLKGEDIPLTARILSVGDVYDALTSSRSYRNAWTHEKAIAVIKKDVGTHFDAKVVEAFLQVIDGIVEEMAAEGYGPLVAPSTVDRVENSKSAQAVRDIQRASSELWALYEVAQTLSSSLGLQETLDILARKLEAILPGVACVFLLKDEQGDGLFARASVGVNREFLTGCKTLNASSLSLSVARDKASFMGEYDSDDLMVSSSQTAQWTPLHSSLIVPIVHQGEVLGTINLYHPQANAFGSHDRQLLETIAERAAMALYNGLLYDRTLSHALTDPLTGLYNMRYLTQQIEERCYTASEDERFAVLCLDLDTFKPINDNFGHQKGDAVLKDLARLFRVLVSETDIVTRYGGDEFVIVLNNAGMLEAEAMAQRIKHAVESYDPELFHSRLGALHLGVSVGFACYPKDGQDCAGLLSAADAQMYREKTEGKLGRLADHPRMRNTSLEDDTIRLPFAA